MESSLVSWQIENFSTAELVSPPVSPAPPSSPTLYNGVPLSHNNIVGKSISALTVIPQSSRANTRAQMASNLLNDLEQFGSGKIEVNDFGMNWNEESVNLGLFEELSEIEYTPPASPKRSFVDPAQHQLTEYSIVGIQDEDQLLSEGSSDLTTLTAEFQAILESLPKDNTSALSQALEIAGIPTTIINGEALVPIELDLTYITKSDMKSIGIEIDDVSVNVISEDDIEIIDESEIFDLRSISNHGSPTPSVYSVQEEVFLMDEDDQQANVAENILDALLQGDLKTAESFIPMQEQDESSMSSQSSSGSEIAVMDVITSPQARTSNPAKKLERRGRKPGKKLAKGSPAYIKDKSIRKKEQNKTAATRYRQKKKIEVALTLEEEAGLQKEKDALLKTKEDLHRQIVMVKSLLREVMQARKSSAQQKQGTSIVRGGRVTVSSVVKNRRK